MEKYTIYCTEEQTKKALELGAPIDTEAFTNDSRPHTTASNPKRHDFIVNCVIPTAEEMIGWLETHGIKEINIYGTNEDKWGYDVWIKYGEKPITEQIPSYHSRKEATLAAIDAALEYLNNNKK